MAMAGGKRAVFVTGAASGIGAAAARRFAREGWFVGLADIDAGGAQALAAELGETRAIALPLDVRERGQWAAAMDRFSQASGGRLDVLLNNAGVARYGWFEEVSPDEADLQLDVNIKGVVNGAYAGLDLLRATKGSRLINVASCAGLYGSPQLAIYSATKFAVRGLSEALDAEFARFGVGVACIMPWFVETPILDSGSARGNQSIRTAIAAGNHPICTVEEAAEVIWRAAHSTELHHLVGKPGKSLRFAARFMPNALRKRLRAAAAG